MTTETRGASEVGDREAPPWQLIVTLFGLYARAENNWLSVASVVTLMADLGIDGPAVRSSISRLKRRGVLHSQRHSGAAGYSLSAATLEMLAEGDVRIFERTRATVDDGWLLAVFSVPETQRDQRYALRTTLTRLGFGTTAPGVWIAPGNLVRETRDTLQRTGLATYVDLFHSEHLGFGDLPAKVRSWWDLDELTALYSDFIDRYRSTRTWATRGDVDNREAFRAYIPMLTEWRRLPYRDPGLPLDLLPQDWNGVTAGALFDQLHAALSGRARTHAMALIHQ